MTEPRSHVSAAAQLRERERRLIAIIARPVAPEGADAELLVLIALTRLLQRCWC